MCTAMTYKTKDRYFGRTLDYERSFGERVLITPRRCPLPFRLLPTMEQHYAIIGMGTAASGYPLYFDAVNETGLAMAGLLFAGFAHYLPPAAGQKNIAPFELIPWVLGQCADLRDVEVLLERAQIADLHFSEELPSSPLHWMIADKERAIVAEQTKAGLRIHDNTPGVLTNSPGFEHQLLRLAEYQNLSPLSPPGYSRGLGAYGLPGDWSSPSRFVRAAFVRQHAAHGNSEQESVTGFFRMMESVSIPQGCMRTDQGDAYTRYTCCCNQDRGIYYYTTYHNPTVTAVDLHGADLEGTQLIGAPS